MVRSFPLFGRSLSVFSIVKTLSVKTFFSSTLLKAFESLKAKMKLSSIEIKDFRAFKGSPLKIDLTDTGKNLLVYGENGSGKSSLYFALRDFLEAASKSSDITKPPFRNIFVKTDDGFIKLDFSDAASDPDAKLYEWSLKTNDTAAPLVLEID